MHSNNNNKRKPTSSFQQNSNNILMLAHSILSLEKNVKMQAEQISQLKDQFNQLFRCVDQQQQPPQSRVNRHGLHRMQPYHYSHTNSLQTRHPTLPAAQSTDQFGWTEQNSVHHYTHTLRSPQTIPSDTQGIDQFDFVTQPNLYLPQQQQQQPVPSSAQITDQFDMKSIHHHTRLPLPPQQEDTSQFELYHNLRSPLPKQQPPVLPITDKYSLMTEQIQPNCHTQSPLPQQDLLPQQTMPNQFGLMAGQNSPYHDTHTLRSSLPKQQLDESILFTETTNQFGHLMLGQIPNSQQLTSHMISGETYPFQPPEFDDSDGVQKNT